MYFQDLYWKTLSDIAPKSPLLCVTPSADALSCQSHNKRRHIVLPLYAWIHAFMNLYTPLLTLKVLVATIDAQWEGMGM